MKKLENIVLHDDDSGEMIPLKSKRSKDGSVKVVEPACTLTLIKLVLNNPMDGVKPDGSPINHSYTVEEMDTALSIMGKVKGAHKAAKESWEGVKTFELEDAESEFVERFVKSYKPLYMGLQWAPFIQQVTSGKEAK